MLYCTFCEVYGIETHAVNKTSSLGIPNDVKITGGLASLSLWCRCSGVARSRIWKQNIVTVAHFFVREVHWKNPLWHKEFRILTLFFSSHQKTHNNNKSSPSISPSATIWAHSICQRTYKSSWFRSWGTPPTNTWQWQLGVPSCRGRTTFTRGRSMKCNDIGKPTEIKYDKKCELEMVWCDMMRHDVTDCDFLAQQPTFKVPSTHLAVLGHVDNLPVFRPSWQYTSELSRSKGFTNKAG